MIFYLTLSIFVLFSSVAEHDSILKNRHISRLLILCLMAIIIVYIPFLDFYVSDMITYITAYQNMHYLSIIDVFRIFSWEPLFLIFQWFISNFSQEPYVYVISLFVLCSSVLIFALKKIFLPWQLVFIFFLYLMFPFFYSYVFNASRQGIGMMFLFLAVFFFMTNQKKFKTILLVIISALFHTTSIVFSISAFIALKIKTKFLVALWLVSSLLYLSGLNRSLIPFDLISEFTRFERYFSGDIISYYGSTNRLDFFVFSAFFVLLSYFLYKQNKNLDDTKKKIYLSLIKVFLMFNSIYLLLGFIAYSDRLASYSWMLIPIIVSYPILHNKKTGHLVIILILFFIFGVTQLPFITYGG